MNGIEKWACEDCVTNTAECKEFENRRRKRHEVRKLQKRQDRQQAQWRTQTRVEPVEESRREGDGEGFRESIGFANERAMQENGEERRAPQALAIKCQLFRRKLTERGKPWSG